MQILENVERIPIGRTALPRLCFVGPMLGRNKGWVTSQGEIQAGLFARDGYPVRMTSTFPNRLLRLADILWSLYHWRKEIDIIQLSIYSGPAFAVADAASRLAQRLGIPQIFVLHGGNLPEFSRRHPGWVTTVLKRGNALVSPSGYLAHHIQRLGFEVTIIPNVLKIENYPYRHREQVRPCLLWMRTFENCYNPEMAVSVLEQLKREYPEVRLTMAGQDRGLLAPLKRLAEEKQLLESVRFAGFLDMEGKQREFKAHDIYLNTNRVDNMPVSVVEAAAFGLPIVATAVGGIPFLLKHAETALLVDNEDVVGMAQAVKHLIVDPGLAGRLSAHGRLLAESCTWPVVRSLWESVFQKVQRAL
jgi:glycosyltransferase involved in cell wall biosynthesis